MKLTIPRDTLAEMTAWATAAASIGYPDGITPILAGLMLTADAGGYLTAARFGYAASATARAAAEVGEPGRVLVPARMLTQVTAALPAEAEAEVTFDGTRVTLEAGGVRYTLLALPAAEYPDLPAEPPEHAAEFDPADLGAAVAIAAAAADDGSLSLPAMACIQIELDGHGTATLTATDMYRLGVATCPYTAGLAEAPGPALVPARELAAALKKPAAGPVRLAVTPAGASLASAGRHVTIRQVQEGEFPLTARIVTEVSKPTTTAVADLAALAAAVKRAAVVAEKNTPARFRFGEGGVRIESGTGDVAALSVTVPLELDGDPLDIAFRPGFLLDSLAAVASTGATRVRIGMTTPKKAALITPPEGDRPGLCTCVLMPVRAAG